MGLFRNVLKFRRCGTCEYCAKHFLFGAVIAATSLQRRFLYKDSFGHHCKDLTVNVHQPTEPDFAHASIRIL